VDNQNPYNLGLFREEQSLIARTKQEAKRGKRGRGTCCPLVPLGAPLKFFGNG